MLAKFYFLHLTYAIYSARVQVACVILAHAILAHVASHAKT